VALHDHERILVFARWGIGDLVLQRPGIRRAAKVEGGSSIG
jgi:hypothetical protein